MTTKHETRNGVDIYGISGRLVMENASEVRTETKALIDEGNGNLVIDLEHLTFIDSSGCSVLISAFKAIRARQGRLVLSHVSPEIMSLFELTRLNEIFEIFPDTEAAIAAIG
jgi:anti-sigma B factor antagonist